MSILIDQNGKVFANKEKANQLLLPVKIGKFEIKSETKKFIENDLNELNVDTLFQCIPTEMKDFCQYKKIFPTKASIFKSKQQEETEKRSEVSQIPHINAGDEIHFFFGGSYIIYFNQNGQHLSVIVEAGDWMFIPADVEHWIKETGDQYLVIVSYHCEPFDIFHSKVKYTATKSRAYL